MPYNVIFGPNICSPAGPNKVHVHKGKNHLIKKGIHCKIDVYTHLYTLIMNTNSTYEVLIDQVKLSNPRDAKPKDWEKAEHIANPDATEPEDWGDKMD